MSRVGDRDERLRSPDFQRDEISRFAEREGLALKMYKPELDVSGSSSSRSTLDEIIRAIEDGELAGIIVAKLDRLSRLKPRDRIELFERIEGAGGAILSATESNDISTTDGRFVRELFLLLARREWERAADGLALAKANAIANGRAIKSVAPFGFRFGDDHGLVVVADEAIVVRELFELREAGASLGEVLAHFERATGRSSYRSTVRAMLANRAYIGELRYGREDELVNAGAHDAIVDVELFDAVQRVSRERAVGRGVAVGKAKSLLAGIVKCESCGRGLTQSATGSRRRRSYKCPNDARHCSARAHIDAELLDDYVIERVLEWAGDLADVEVEAEVELDHPAARALAERRLAEAEASLVDFAADLDAEGRLGRDAYKAGLDARTERVELRKSELAALGQASELEVARGSVREVLTDDDYNDDERRELLDVVLASVIVRRTPRRGAPASERAELVFTEAMPADDATKPIEKTPAHV